MWARKAQEEVPAGPSFEKAILRARTLLAYGLGHVEVHDAIAPEYGEDVAFFAYHAAIIANKEGSNG